MELGLSLGDNSSSKLSGGFFKTQNKRSNTCSPEQQNPQKSNKITGLGFCMALGINSNGRLEDPVRETAQKSQENEEGDDQTSDGDDHLTALNTTPVQLDLLPLASVPSHTQPLPWSSDNGSSDNGSSGNVGMTSGRGFDVNRLPTVAGAGAEEVSSPNSVASSFQMDFSIYNRGGGGYFGGLCKRNSEAAGNDGVEGERASSRASDEDENGVNTRKKLRLSKEQSAYLEESFKEHHTLNPKQKLALAKQLNLMPRQVEVWFQNRRARTKLKQTEVDCEYLKRCCETLTEENRRLHKELQELRALKSSNPFYMQLPATTLTMCPSCERVATTSTAPSAATAAAKATNNPNNALPATNKTKTNSPTSDSTPKGIPFPLSRPRFYPFSPTHTPHQSAAS